MRQRIVCVMVCAGLAVGAGAQTKTWTGDSGDGEWTTDGNWDPSGVPGAGSDVRIPSDAGVVKITLTGAECAALSCQSGLSLNSGQITVSGTGTVRNLTFSPGGFTPVVWADGLFTISGTSQATGGLVSGLGQFVNAGTFNTTTFTISVLTARNEGTWNVTGNGSLLQISDGGTLANNGTLTIAGGNEIRGASPDDLCINSGTLSATGAGLVTITGGFDQLGGTLRADTAVIDLLADAWLLEGTVEVANNGVVLLGGTNNTGMRDVALSTISGQGRVDVYGPLLWSGQTAANVAGGGVRLGGVGTIQLDGTLTNNGTLYGSGGLLSGAGQIVSNGSLGFDGTRSLDLRVNMGNDGTATLDGTLMLGDGKVFTNLSGGWMELTELSLITPSNTQTTGKVTNLGAIRVVVNDAPFFTRIETPIDFLGFSELFVNEGLFSMTGGGSFAQMTVQMGTPDKLASCELLGDANTTWDFNATTSIAGTGQFDFGAFPNVRPVVNVNGTVDMSLSGTGFPAQGGGVRLRGASIQGTGTMVNTDLMRWHSGVVGAKLQNDSILFLEVLGGGQTLANVLTNNDSVGQSALLTIDGGSVQNNSLWSAVEGASLQITGAGGTFVNAGSYLTGLSGDADYSVFCDFDNQGTVHATKNVLWFAGGVAQYDIITRTLSGGSWLADSGASIVFADGITGIHGPARVRAGTNEMPGLTQLSDVDTGGLAELLDSIINGDVSVRNGSELRAKGNVQIGGRYSATGSSTTTIEPGATLEAAGGVQNGDVDSAADDLSPISVIAFRTIPPKIITPLLENYAVLTLGGEGFTGHTDLEGSMMLYPSSRVRFEAKGTSGELEEFDELAVTGAVTLDGTLELGLVGGYVPSAGDSFVLLSAAGGVNGVFSAVEGAALPGGLAWDVSYAPTTVTVTVNSACQADWNGDGNVNTQDFLAYLNAWSSGDLSADLNGDGVVNTQDFLAFLNLWVAGC